MDSREQTANGIKSWAIEDRPREKFLHKGRQALTDSELLAILIGSGTVGQNVLDLSKEILQKVGNDLNELGRSSLKELKEHKGIGEAKAITIAAAMELGRRRQMTANKFQPEVKSAQQSVAVIGPAIMDLPHEEFWILHLNRANKLIRSQKISSGGFHATVVDVKMVIRSALDAGASAIVLAHNHPSGNKNPSTQDISLTKQIKAATEIMGLQLLDHIIIARSDYYSFAEAGQL